jgi:hypothetical protein
VQRKHALSEGDRAFALRLRARIDEALLQRGEGREGLEGRARRVRAGDRLVERGLERIGVEPPKRVADHLLARAAGDGVGVEARLRIEAEDAARAHVDHGHAAGELAAEGLVEGLLHVGVEREPEIAPRDRVGAARVLDDPLAAGLPPTARVDEHLLPAARAAEVALPRALDAGDADAIALHVARRAQRRQALTVDLGHVAEHVRAHVVVRVIAHRDRHDLDAGQLRLVGREVRHRVARHVLLEQDLLLLALAVGGAQGEHVLLEAGALVEAHAEVVDELGPDVDHVETRGDDVDVVRRPARGEHLPRAIADDPARRRQRDAPDDVLPSDGAVLVGVDDLELEEPAMSPRKSSVIPRPIQRKRRRNSLTSERWTTRLTAVPPHRGGAR